MTQKNPKKESGKEAASGNITKKMPIGQIVSEHPELAEVFMKHGMHCLGCAAAHFENLEQGCQAHGLDADALVADLNKALESGNKKKKEE